MDEFKKLIVNQFNIYVDEEQYKIDFDVDFDMIMMAMEHFNYTVAQFLEGRFNKGVFISFIVQTRGKRSISWN